MKKRRFILAILANLSPVVFAALCYSGGALVVWALLCCLHVLLYMLNRYCANSFRQLAFLGLEHILTTVASHKLYSYLYSRFICDDIPGRAISILGLMVGTVWTVILLIASLIAWKIKHRRQIQHSGDGAETSPIE